jgi:hypothetical protein
LSAVRIADVYAWQVVLLRELQLSIVLRWVTPVTFHGIQSGKIELIYCILAMDFKWMGSNSQSTLPVNFVYQRLERITIDTWIMNA